MGGLALIMVAGVVYRVGWVLIFVESEAFAAAAAVTATTGDANWVSKALVALVKAAWRRRLRRVTAPMKVDMMVIDFYEDRGLMGLKRKVCACCLWIFGGDRQTPIINH